MTDSTHIRVEDAYPRPGARPVDDALVASIAEGMRLVGFMPSEAVLVRRSGNRFIIIDGQHRIEAARRVGLAEVPAYIEDVDDAHALTFEGVANIQRPDTEQERWARAQDFFDLEDAGAPAPAPLVAAATGLTAEQQAVVRRVRRVVNDREAMVDQHSFERAAAIDEFADDPDAVAALINASERDWRRVVAELRRGPEPEPAIESGPDHDALSAFIARRVEDHRALLALMDAEVDALIGDLPVYGRTTRLAVAWLLRMAKERGGDKAFIKAAKADGFEGAL